MNKTFVGIDVGKKGGIVSITKTDNGTVITTARTPLVNEEIDLVSLKSKLQSIVEVSNDLIIGIEAVATVPKSSAKANFQFGRALGLLEGLVSGMGLAFVKINAKKWQKVYFEGIPVTHKAGTPKKDGKTGAMIPTEKVDTKAMALCASRRLYPNVNLLATERSSVPHEGIVDSLGIAHYLSINN